MAVSFGKVQESKSIHVEVLSGSSMMRVPLPSVEMLDKLKASIAAKQKELETSKFAETFPIGSKAILVANNIARNCTIERLEINLVMPGLQLIPCVYLKFKRQENPEYFPLERLQDGFARLVKTLEELYVNPN
jgi:hypothetical protein